MLACNPGDADMRQSPRLKTKITVRYRSDSAMVQGDGFDLSEKGISFSGESVLPVGTYVEIEFRIDSPHAEWFRTKGIVRHVEQNRMGVEFHQIGDAARIKILQAIYHELALRRHA